MLPMGNLMQVDCTGCGVTFWLTYAFLGNRVKNEASFMCPNGCEIDAATGDAVESDPICAADENCGDGRQDIRLAQQIEQLETENAQLKRTVAGLSEGILFIKALDELRKGVNGAGISLEEFMKKVGNESKG